MDKQRRKELQARYKQMKLYMGVVKITNTVNGKFYIDAYPDLRDMWAAIQTRLDSGIYSSASLVRDWKQYGPGAFTYDVLEQREQTGDTPDELRQVLGRMERAWLDKLQPYGDKGYNHPPRW